MCPVVATLLAPHDTETSVKGLRFTMIKIFKLDNYCKADHSSRGIKYRVLVGNFEMNPCKVLRSGFVGMTKRTLP